MNVLKTPKGMWTWVLCVGLAGFWSLASGWQEARAASQRMIRKRGVLLMLNSLASRQAAEAARLATLANEGAPRTAVDTLAAAVLPERTLTVRDATNAVVAGAWNVRDVVLSAGELGTDELVLLMNQVETQRPPWRVMGMTLNASRQPRMAGDIQLRLRAVGRR